MKSSSRDSRTRFSVNESTKLIIHSERRAERVCSHCWNRLGISAALALFMFGPVCHLKPWQWVGGSVQPAVNMSHSLTMIPTVVWIWFRFRHSLVESTQLALENVPCVVFRKQRQHVRPSGCDRRDLTGPHEFQAGGMPNRVRLLAGQPDQSFPLTPSGRFSVRLWSGKVKVLV
ncbi:hypothetical protein ElyMa_001037600 [Elysia marginata]|uniref:Uncharacterized protein n=1 Tax=Elysia marginata TaxID=1093978 RepID=A0AAV4HQX4_9GAST|nr:hypothetical protein ElyMa_001037600 [Elysia marginata]